MNAKIPPHSLEAERCVIGAALLERDALLVALGVGLRPEMFYRESHRRVYEAQLAVLEAGEAVDVVTVAERLREAGWLDKVGGVAGLAALADSVPTPANTEHYARIVREKYTRRRMIQAASEIARLAYDERGELSEQCGQAEKLLMDATQEEARGKLERFGVTVTTHWEALWQSRGQPDVVGLRTGLHDLDTALGGLQRGDLIVLAARPSQGKTALAMTIVRNVAERGAKVAVFSLEMSRLALAERMVCAEARLDSQAVRARALRQSEWDRAFDAAVRVARLPIWVDDGLTTTLEMRARARRLAVDQGLDLVVIDYVGLIQDRPEPGMSRAQHVGQITQRCKAMARELHVPVLLLAQLNRAVEQRQDKMPTLADLRESGEIEQVADVVLFIHNPQEDMRSGPREIIVAKQRNGPTGKVRVYFHREYTRFEDLETRREEVAEIGPVRAGKVN